MFQLPHQVDGGLPDLRPRRGSRPGPGCRGRGQGGVRGLAAQHHSDDDDQSPSHVRRPGESQTEHEDQETEAESRQQEEEGGETEEESSSTAEEGSVDVEGERFERQTQALEATRPQTLPHRQCLV